MSAEPLDFRWPPVDLRNDCGYDPASGDVGKRHRGGAPGGQILFELAGVGATIKHASYHGTVEADPYRPRSRT